MRLRQSNKEYDVCYGSAAECAETVVVPLRYHRPNTLRLSHGHYSMRQTFTHILRLILVGQSREEGSIPRYS